jgi:hypothetical protein
MALANRRREASCRFMAARTHSLWDESGPNVARRMASMVSSVFVSLSSEG